MKKRVVTGDFVTREGHDGSWMITTITKNYELDIIQARVIKVGDPNIVEQIGRAHV